MFDNLIEHVIHQKSVLAPVSSQSGYGYALAAGGIYLRNDIWCLQAVRKIAEADVRGLFPLEESFELKIPRIPESILLSFLASSRREALRQPPREILGVIRYTDCYSLHFPEQKTTTVSVDARLAEGQRDRILCDIHSHNNMPAFHSAEADDVDEVDNRIYATVGRVLTDKPEISVRLGVYGYFFPLEADLVFENASRHFTDVRHLQARYKALDALDKLPI